MTSAAGVLAVMASWVHPLSWSAGVRCASVKPGPLAVLAAESVRGGPEAVGLRWQWRCKT